MESIMLAEQNSTVVLDRFFSLAARLGWIHCIVGPFVRRFRCDRRSGLIIVDSGASRRQSFLATGSLASPCLPRQSKVVLDKVGRFRPVSDGPAYVSCSAIFRFALQRSMWLSGYTWLLVTKQNRAICSES